MTGIKGSGREISVTSQREPWDTIARPKTTATHLMVKIKKQWKKRAKTHLVTGERVWAPEQNDWRIVNPYRVSRPNTKTTKKKTKPPKLLRSSTVRRTWYLQSGPPLHSNGLPTPEGHDNHDPINDVDPFFHTADLYQAIDPPAEPYDDRRDALDQVGEQDLDDFEFPELADLFSQDVSNLRRTV